MSMIKYHYELKDIKPKEGEVADPHRRERLPSKTNDIDLIVNAVPTEGGTYYGVIEADKIPVYGGCGPSKAVVLVYLERWLEANYMLVKEEVDE